MGEFSVIRNRYSGSRGDIKAWEGDVTVHRKSPTKAFFSDSKSADTEFLVRCIDDQLL